MVFINKRLLITCTLQTHNNILLNRFKDLYSLHRWRHCELVVRSYDLYETVEKMIRGKKNEKHKVSRSMFNVALMNVS